MNIKNPEDFNVRFNHKFFLDTNVWIYLNFPEYSNVHHKIINKYSEFFKEIVSKQCLICTNMIQMSELINVIIHSEYKEFKKSNRGVSIKEYRSSQDGQKALENAKTITQVVLKACSFETGAFNNDQLKNMVTQCDKADLNDIYFAKYCQSKNSLLVTHDYDFSAIEGELEVLSFNSKYYS